MNSTIRYYDEGVLKYFSDIAINDGVEYRNCQALMAVPSRKGVRIEKNKNETPIMPFVVLTRTGLQPRNDTHLVKGHITRNSTFKGMSSNIKNYDMIETMGYDYNYQLDLFSLQQEMFNQMIEHVLYKTEKQHYVPVNIETANFNITDNSFISGVNYTDSTGYSQIADSSYRIFHGTLTFTVHGYIIIDNQSAKSVLNVEDTTNINNEIIITSEYTGTIEELIEKRKKQQSN